MLICRLVWPERGLSEALPTYVFLSSTLFDIFALFVRPFGAHKQRKNVFFLDMSVFGGRVGGLLFWLRPTCGARLGQLLQLLSYSSKLCVNILDLNLYFRWRRDAIARLLELKHM